MLEEELGLLQLLVLPAVVLVALLEPEAVEQRVLEEELELLQLLVLPALVLIALLQPDAVE